MPCRLRYFPRLVLTVFLLTLRLNAQQAALGTVIHSRSSGMWLEVHQVCNFTLTGTGTNRLFLKQGSSVFERTTSGGHEIVAAYGSWTSNPGTISFLVSGPVYTGPTTTGPWTQLPFCTSFSGNVVSLSSEFWNWITRYIDPISFTFDKGTGLFTVTNPYAPPVDTDGDGDSDEIDVDDDGDGIPDNSDPHRTVPDGNPDTDGDGQHDWQDPDDDNDGSYDGDDTSPLDPDELPVTPPDDPGNDTDGDGIKDINDADDDNDGVSDGFDRYPKYPGNGGNGGGSGNPGTGTPEGPEPGGDGGTGAMNSLTEGDHGLSGSGKPTGNPGGDISSARDSMRTKLQNFQLLQQGTIPRATSWTRTVSVQPFGSMNLAIDFSSQPFPAIRACLLVLITLLLGNSLLKRLTI